MALAEAEWVHRVACGICLEIEREIWQYGSFVRCAFVVVARGCREKVEVLVLDADGGGGSRDRRFSDDRNPEVGTIETEFMSGIEVQRFLTGSVFI